MCSDQSPTLLTLVSRGAKALDDVEEDEFVPAEDPDDPEDPESTFSPILSVATILEPLDASLNPLLRLPCLGLLLLSLSLSLSLSSLSRLEDEFLSKYEGVRSLSLSVRELGYFELE